MDDNQDNADRTFITKAEMKYKANVLQMNRLRFPKLMKYKFGLFAIPLTQKRQCPL